MIPDIITADMITFDPIAHRYTLPDGRVVPSVTQILAATGISADFEAIGARSAFAREVLEAKRDLGTAVHADCHAWDDQDLDVEAVHPDVRPYLDAWIAFRANTGFAPEQRERIVYHPGLNYCGRLDAIGRIKSGRVILVDIATGDPEHSAKRYQTAAYMGARYMQGDETDWIDERWAVQLTPDNGIPYRIHVYSDWSDFSKFSAFCTTYHHQACRRIER
jgi:hypothetical protein